MEYINGGTKFEYDISIDRITLVGFPSKKPRKNIINFMNREIVVEKQWINPDGRYHYNAKLLDGSFLQFTHHSSQIQQIRYDFNPNSQKLDWEKLIPLKVIGCMVMPEPSRIDTAIDIYNYPLEKLWIMDKKRRKKILYVDWADTPETIYIGSAESDERIRIYNKKKEREKENATIPLGVEDWWRIEGQLRREKAKTISYNPFQKLYFTRKFDIGKEYDLRTRAMLYYLQQDKQALREMNSRTRAKYEELLLALGEDTFTVDTIYNLHREELDKQVKNYLSYADCNGDEVTWFMQAKSNMREEEGWE